jgi:hypothetical protein
MKMGWEDAFEVLATVWKLPTVIHRAVWNCEGTTWNACDFIYNINHK